MAADIPSIIGAEGAYAAANLLNRPAEEFGNDASIEALWAIKAYEHAEVYFNILCSVDPKLLKLTQHDNKIYTEFRKHFPDFKIDVLIEDTLKSPEAKEKWREFCNSFQEVDDFNFATLVRLNCSEEYTEENSLLVTRIQFFAIEIARNKEGFNDIVRTKFQPKKRK